MQRHLTTALFLASAAAAAKTLCASEGGAFVALAVDDVFTVTPPRDARDPERWELVRAASRSAKERVENSFTGSYFQVLPDDGDDYNKVTEGDEFTMTKLSVRFRTSKAGPHSLFARWSGGDTVGGGDSMYVAMATAKGAPVRGALTWRESKVAIDDTRYEFVGCCYDMQTHACPCREGNATLAEAGCEEAGGYWATAADASHWGAQCPAGQGLMESVAPLWYEFAGQEYGNVMDFDSEPWDATCEAEGVGTADSGRDEATWDLAAGAVYELRFFPREDGVALEAIYLAPFGAAPPTGLRLAAGDSSLCPESSSSSSSGSTSHAGLIVTLVVVLAALAALGAGAWAWRRRRVAKGRGRASYVEMDGFDRSLTEGLEVDTSQEIV